MHHIKFGMFALALALVVLALGVGRTLYQNQGPQYAPAGPGGVACSMEAKLCSDGSYVGRTGPNCEFAACPGAGAGSRWQTYQSAAYGLSLQYPGTLSVDPQGSRYYIVALDGSSTKMNVATDSIAAGVSLTQFLAKSDADAQHAWEGQASYEVDSTKNVTVGGLPAIQREVLSYAAPMNITETYVKKGNIAYRFELLPMDPENGYATSDVDLYNQILATVKFQ